MRSLTVQAYKYDGSKHYSYPVQLLEATPALLIVHGGYGRPLSHPGRGMVNVPVPNRSIEFHFINRRYNITAFEENGRFKGYYCNIITPTQLEGDLIIATDMDLDLKVHADYSYTVEDEDEFEERRVAWGYPPELVAECREALAELIRLVESRAYPFDGTAPNLLRGLTATPPKV